MDGAVAHDRAELTFTCFEAAADKPVNRIRYRPST